MSNLSALKILRSELPALGLCVGFAPVAQREALAALLLLWLELRRAGQASESMLAATRMAWWRDALKEGRAEGVPLVDILVKLNFYSVLAEEIEKMVEQTLSAGRAAPPHSMIAVMLARAAESGETGKIANLLARLDGAIGGRASPMQGKTGHVAFDLLDRCCAKPARLEYPARHPLLALQMVGWAVFTRRD